MSGSEPNTPEPHTIALEHPTPITSSQSDDVVPPPEEAEMKTFGMSTSVRMQAGVPSAASAEKDVASDLFADVSDTGDAPASGVRDFLIWASCESLFTLLSLGNALSRGPGGAVVDSCGHKATLQSVGNCVSAVCRNVCSCPCIARE